jgi:hypothetical protein
MIDTVSETFTYAAKAVPFQMYASIGAKALAVAGYGDGEAG